MTSTTDPTAKLFVALRDDTVLNTGIELKLIATALVSITTAHIGDALPCYLHSCCD